MRNLMRCGKAPTIYVMSAVYINGVPGRTALFIGLDYLARKIIRPIRDMPNRQAEVIGQRNSLHGCIFLVL